jgi:hypothetical protein
MSIRAWGFREREARFRGEDGVQHSGVRVGPISSTEQHRDGAHLLEVLRSDHGDVLYTIDFCPEP